MNRCWPIALVVIGYISVAVLDSCHRADEVEKAEVPKWDSYLTTEPHDYCTYFEIFLDGESLGIFPAEPDGSMLVATEEVSIPYGRISVITVKWYYPGGGWDFMPEFLWVWKTDEGRVEYIRLNYYDLEIV